MYIIFCNVNLDRYHGRIISAPTLLATDYWPLATLLPLDLQPVKLYNNLFKDLDARGITRPICIEVFFFV